MLFLVGEKRNGMIKLMGNNGSIDCGLNYELLKLWKDMSNFCKLNE